MECYRPVNLSHFCCLYGDMKFLASSGLLGQIVFLNPISVVDPDCESTKAVRKI